MQKIISITVTLAIITGIILAFNYSLNKSLDNRDVMLCNSALKSLNREYLKKCQCFYQGQSISCIYNKEVKSNANR